MATLNLRSFNLKLKIYEKSKNLLEFKQLFYQYISNSENKDELCNLIENMKEHEYNIDINVLDAVLKSSQNVEFFENMFNYLESQKQIPLKNVKDKIYQIGKKYGYPDCCILSFIYENTASSATKVQRISLCIMEKSSSHIGFIPCDTCAKKICDGTYKKLTDLIKREPPIKCKDFGIYSKEEQELLYKECKY